MGKGWLHNNNNNNNNKNKETVEILLIWSVSLSLHWKSPSSPLMDVAGVPVNTVIVHVRSATADLSISPYSVFGVLLVLWSEVSLSPQCRLDHSRSMVFGRSPHCIPLGIIAIWLSRGGNKDQGLAISSIWNGLELWDCVSLFWTLSSACLNIELVRLQTTATIHLRYTTTSGYSHTHLCTLATITIIKIWILLQPLGYYCESGCHFPHSNSCP